MNNEFTYASLFAGIGGFESGLNKLGGRNVFASEIDKFARQSYEVLYGMEPSGDITQIESKDIPSHDLLTAGFPCQSFSVAGKRAGMAYVCRDCEHEQTISFNQYADRDFVCESCGGVIEVVDGRGLLFFEVTRVARDKQPKVILLENVKGLVGHDKGRTLDTIVRTLSDIGYVVDFDVLNSKFYGVPQNRERIFVVAVREDIQPHEPWTEESRKGQTVIPKGKRRIFEYDEVKTFNFDFPTNDKVAMILRDVLEESVDEKYYLDEEKTTTLIEELEFDVKEGQGGVVYNRKDGVKTEIEIAKTLSASDWRGLNRNQDQTAVIESLPVDCEIRRSEDIEFVGFVSEDGIRKGVDESKLHLSRTHKQPNRIHGTNGIHPSISSSEVSGRYYVADVGATVPQDPNMLGLLDMKGNESIRRVYDPNACGPTLTTMGGGHREPKIVEGKVIKYDFEFPVSVRKYDVDEVELVNFLRWHKELSQKTIKEIAKDTNVPLTEAEHWFRRDSSFAIPRPEVWVKLKQSIGIVSDEWDKRVMSFETKAGVFDKSNRVYDDVGISPTLTAASSDEKVLSREVLRIRKLTPKECWRLQGFTDEQHDAVERAGVSNAQRYKQAGNAVTVNVIEAIGEKLLPYLQKGEV